MPEPLNEGPFSGKTGEFDEFAGGVSELFRWAATMRGALTVGDVLKLNPDQAELPFTQRRLWRKLSGIPIAGQSPVEPVLAIQLAQLLEAIDADELAMYLRRIDLADPQTLQSIATERGLTRERIRQVLARVERRLLASLQRPGFDRLSWMIEEVTRRLRSHFPVDELGEIPEMQAIESALLIAPAISQSSELAPGIPPTRDLARSLTLRLAGGYRVANDWVSLGSGTAERCAAPLLDLVRDRRIVSLPHAVRVLDDADFSEPAARFYLRTSPKLRVIDGLVYWWQGDIAMEAAVALQRIGRPATANELLGLLEGSRTIRTLRNALHKHPEIVRVSKTEFALKEWGRHEYSSISDEIDYIIKSRGGSAPLSGLVSEISAKYRVAEQSVMQYAFAPRFISQGGMVRIRTPDEPFEIRSPQPLREAGVFSLCGFRVDLFRSGKPRNSARFRTDFFNSSGVGTRSQAGFVDHIRVRRWTGGNDRLAGAGV